MLDYKKGAVLPPDRVLDVHTQTCPHPQCPHTEISSCIATFPWFLENPYIFPSFPSFRMWDAVLLQPMDLGTCFSSPCILHKSQSVNPSHWQYPAPMGSWRVWNFPTLSSRFGWCVPLALDHQPRDVTGAWEMTSLCNLCFTRLRSCAGLDHMSWVFHAYSWAH